MSLHLENSSEWKPFFLKYNGDGKTFFGIAIVNLFLTILTLGFYYPWAKARQLQYWIGSTTLNEDPFTFHGTGNEMFRGYIKLFIYLLFIISIPYLFINHAMNLASDVALLFTGLFVYIFTIIIIVPLAIHGSYRYRMSRISWRGIRFGYRGSQKELVKKFLVNTFLTIITFGFYGAWMHISLRKYVMNRIRFGDIEIKYFGTGDDYFWINFKSYFFTLFTLGIYFFWWRSELFAFHVDYTRFSKDDQVIRLKSTATGPDFFSLYIVNFLILIFSLGIAFPFVVNRTIEFYVNHIQGIGNIDLDRITQTEDDLVGAEGEGLSDLMDIDAL